MTDFRFPDSQSLEESYSYCQSLTRRTARNFYYSFLTLPADKLREMCVLYAYMRLSDDLGDAPDVSPGRKFAQLDDWGRALERALVHGEFSHDVFPALADVARRCEIPHEYLSAVIEGVRQDVEPAGFQTFDELREYCYRVAGAVGLCCIHVWGFHDLRAVPRAIDCGCAFQLTNILRDLAEDADMGRLYLPQEDLERFGYSAADIVGRRLDERFLRLMQFEVDRARQYYRQAEPLAEYLDPIGRPILAAMMRIYGGLLDRIERSGYDVFSHRISLPAWQKWGITLDVLLRRRWRGIRATNVSPSPGSGLRARRKS